jgi:Cu/Ag efflux protein CusF
MKSESNAQYSSAANLIFVFLLSVTTLLAASCQKKQTTTTTQPVLSPSTKSENTSTPQSSPIEIRSYQGTGIVTKVVRENPHDKSLASVELDHGEIVGLMPAMRMEFYVKDVSLLNGIKVGDLIDFTIEVKGPTETISEIRKK